jgi:hypothetical protein
MRNGSPRSPSAPIAGRASALAVVVVLGLFAAPAAEAQDCATKAGAMQTLEGIRAEATALYK